MLIYRQHKQAAQGSIEPPPYYPIDQGSTSRYEPSLALRIDFSSKNTRNPVLSTVFFKPQRTPSEPKSC